MLELDAVNDILASVGESPVTSLAGSHPLLESAQRFLAQASKREQAKGWWFNTRLRTLDQDGGGEVALPADVLSADPTYRPDDFTVRAGKLFDKENGTFVIGADVECAVVELLDFEDLPETAAAYFVALACHRFAKGYDADTTKLNQLKDEVGQALVPFKAEHIRASDVNLFASGTTAQNLAFLRHQRYIIRG